MLPLTQFVGDLASQIDAHMAADTGISPEVPSHVGLTVGAVRRVRISLEINPALTIGYITGVPVHNRRRADEGPDDFVAGRIKPGFDRERIRRVRVEGSVPRDDRSGGGIEIQRSIATAGNGPGDRMHIYVGSVPRRSQRAAVPVEGRPLE